MSVEQAAYDTLHLSGYYDGNQDAIVIKKRDACHFR